ncbi:MAG TPA: hypothetical protein VK249_14325 [Anaerolineales bacterium]|nr:hypothetical protein [Anaerolineales bacterium]
MNRNRLIVGLVILAVFMILLLAGSLILLMEWNSRPVHISGRKPLSHLGYCSSMQVMPCILSFSLGSDGKMVINVLTKSSAPDFYLKIRNATLENIYECQKVKGFSTQVSCTGEASPPGDVLQFLLVSTDGNTPFAEGRFPVIGLALATPEIYFTPTFPPPPTRPPR